MAAKKIKVAVLGGGIGGLVAAYELSKTKTLQSKYEVTVYQMGWRLGGKGASGRNTSPEGFDRIEEHGLHIWLGNYQNAFLLMKECYDHCYRRGLTPYSPFRQWQDAFKKHSLITLMEETQGGWSPWQILMPATDGWPGEAEQCLSLEQLIARGLELLEGVRDETPISPPPELAISPQAHLDAACEVCAHMEQKAKTAKAVPRAEYEALDRHLRDFHRGYRSGKKVHIDQSDVQRRRWILIDLATTHLRGVLEDVLLQGKDSLSEIDHKDFRQWLADHGAEPESINSAPVRNTYEIVFGYRGGDEAQPSFAAGTAVRFLLRWVGTYRGGFIYKMQAGMGDVVFSPLYLTLKDRGVKFRFFHKALSLHLDAGKKNVERIHMAEQVELAGTAEYDPLLIVKGVPSWPAAPRYDGQINPAHKAAIEQLKIDFPGLEPLESAYSPWVNHRDFDLQRGTDFDQVVLAIPLGALPGHCAELINANPKFAAMVQNVGTVATQSFQLWLNRDQHQLGWRGSEPAILDSYRDSYADFSQLIPRESHPPGTVQNIAYLCKTLEDLAPIPGHGPNPSYERDEHERVKVWSRDTFLNGTDGMRPIWPNAYDPGTGDLRWDWLTDLRAAPGAGADRFDAQFWCANVNPSDRYVQALAGTTQHRLKAEESGFDNVALAGDWVKTGVDAGCIEGATLGGMQAARAISGSPKKISGEHDFCQSGASGCMTAIVSLFLKVFDFFKRLGGRFAGVKTFAPPALCPAVKPPYVERGGEQVFPQPYLFHDCVLHGFVVDASYMALKELCDKHLNDPSHGALDYWPAIGRVVVARLDVPRAHPENPMEYDYGFIRESDVSFFIPVVAFDGIIPVGMGAFAPYLFVDHPWGILGGREAYGLHKIPSSISPMAFGSSTLFGVNSYAVPATGLMTEVPHQLVLSVVSAPGAPAPAFAGAAFAHLFAARTIAGVTEAIVAAAEGIAIPAPPGTRGEWTIREAGEAWDAIAKMIFGEALEIEIPARTAILKIQNFLSGGVLPMVALKQFRDVANGRFACYQAVTESPAELTSFTGATLINDPLMLRIENLVSQPLRADFGWGPGDLPITGAFQTQFSFKVGNGREVWRA
jgi:uncharacterized protein with NAD-binding domain and iron-sulfur cluster